MGKSSLFKTSETLLRALNNVGYPLLFGSREFIGRDDNLHKYYAVYEYRYDVDKRSTYNVEVYGSTSMVRIVLYLRDLWYLHNGKELPTDQELWNTVRAELMRDGVYDVVLKGRKTAKSRKRGKK